MFAFTTEEILLMIGRVWWPFFRIAGAFTLLPFFSNGHIPVRVKVLFAFFLAALVGPMLPTPPPVDPLSPRALLIAFEQLAVGAMMGLMLSMLLHILSMLGQMLSMQMGLAMSVMNDPANGVNHALLGQWMVMYGTLLFLALDGHLVALGVLVESFTLWPIGSGVLDLPLMTLIMKFGWTFAMALMLAFPAVMAMLMVNITFGVLNKSAPSLNVYSLGFPLAMMLGLVSILISFSGLPERYADLCLDALTAMHQFVGGTP
ncbi:flagellar biosynthetic protein FliR [Ferrimonas balearica]|uniref:flagellar biosynthetic protein FliR n=1 Tax=Ferrimonas balearica TaxID=44012 RepID=UPI001C99AAF6|nr:flagellar biosynthetic protein FliR [Ferrimonas balearica]MBY5920000.1 flagellar biosynthetic protein FliR [Ferrimonas balearica]MBY5997315.1 flagellar biosynthetic protein FliR [Ferrimonas balearica]